MPLYRMEAPGAAAVSLADMKKHLNVDHTDDDDLIEALTAAATDEIDGNTGIGRSLVDQVWEYRLEDFVCAISNGNKPNRRAGAHGYSSDFDRAVFSRIEIPLPPLIEIESVKYFDRDNVEQTLGTSVYEVIGAAGHSRAAIALKSGQSWPAIYDRPEAVNIRFRSGYVDTSNSPPVGEVPPKIVASIKLMTGTLYANRETLVIGQSVIELPWAAQHLVKRYRDFTF